MRKRAFIVLAGFVSGLAVIAWCALPRTEPQPGTFPNPGAAAIESPAQVVGGDRPSREREGESSDAMPVELPTSSPEGSPEESGPASFPGDYHGPRDANLFEVYSVYKLAMETAARRLADPSLRGLELASVKDAFLRHSAYITLIQQQRFHLYFHGRRTPDQRVPVNTKDVVYHSTGMGDMQVTFELRRSEFPDMFEALDELTKRFQMGGAAR